MGAVSKLESFNRGFVQVSMLLLVLSQALNTLFSNNELIKFADDLTLSGSGELRY